MEKACTQCGVTKPLTSYYAHKARSDGRMSLCKECQRQKSRATRKKKISYYREYDRQRYRNDTARKKRTQSALKRKRETNNGMRAATVLIGNAIRDGRIERRPCEVCGDHKSEAHHPDYLRPMEVMWLCRSHHIQWHHENGPGRNANASPDAVKRAADGRW